MRRPILSAVLFAVAASGLIASAAAAQTRGEREEQQQRDRRKAEEAKKKDKDEWNAPLGRLPGQRNVGPCPFVKVLYDASRYAEFTGGREASAAVGYTGEIQGVSAGCVYRDADPIEVTVDIGFAFGKGPMAEGSSKTYNYWVAVTRRNSEVLAKESFTVPVTFKPGQDRVVQNERLEGIVIPRASETTSGSNFEILIGFDVTPQMAEFNREGKRFRVNATPVQSAQAGGASAP